MKRNIEYPRNGFSHHALIAKFEVTIEFAKRDVELLVDFGINEARISSIETKINQLKAISTFNTDKATKVLSTVLRKDTNYFLYKELKKVRKRVGMVLPITSDAYKQHMSGNLATTNLEKFVKIAERIAEGLKIYSAQLGVLGINDEFILTLENQIADFTNVVKNDKIVKKTTDEKTLERGLLMADLYSELSKLCRAGKAIWEDENPARYKDYIIFDTRKKSKANSEAENSPPYDTIYEELDSLQ